MIPHYNKQSRKWGHETSVIAPNYSTDMLVEPSLSNAYKQQSSQL